MLIIESNESDGAGLTILTDTNRTAKIHFSDEAPSGKIEYSHSTNTMSFYAFNHERLTIKSGGFIGVGTTAPVHLLQVQDGDLAVVTNSADANGQSLVFTKSRNATDGSHTVVNDNDVLGEIEFKGSDGDSFEVGAKIIARVDGTPSDGNMPTEIVFASGDGSEYLSVGQANSLFWTDGESSGNTGTQTVGLVIEKNNTDIPNNKSVLIGARAGKASDNHSLTIIGSEAGEYGAGAEATIVGYFAGNAGPSNNVTLIGSRAGSAMNSTGNHNVCVGSYSGDTITSGDLNVCVGSFSDAAATTSNQIAIGYQATATIANEAVIGNTDIAAIRPMSAGQCLIGGAGFEVSGMVGFGGGVLMGRAAAVSSINQDQKILAQVFASSASVLTIPANSYVVRMGITSTSNADSNAYSVTLNTGTVSGETALGALTNSVERIGAGAANSRTSASTGSAADLAVAATGSHTKVVGITTEGFFAGTDDLYVYVMTAGTGNANTGSGLNFTFGVFVEYIGMD